MFAHSADATSNVMAATACGLPRWAKLSPNVPDVVEIASGALEGGADGLTLVNTLLGLALDTETGRPVLGAGGGGLSGSAVHPVAVRAVWECRGAFPGVPIVGVGGVLTGRDAVELLLAGADAVQVGTATFRDPRAPWKVLRQLAQWCDTHRVTVHDIRTQARLRAEAGRGEAPTQTIQTQPTHRQTQAPTPTPPTPTGRRRRSARAVAQRRRPPWVTASGTALPRPCGATGPLCAGIDPSAALLAEWGLSDDAVGLRSFCRTCVEAFAGTVAVIKPQVAFFERHGSAGMAELERLIVEASAAGLIVIADAKRGDIDSTAEAYADAWLGAASPFAADAVTAHPYLGLGALAPLVRLAAANGRGVLVVARSSNPEGRGLQQAVTADGTAVEDIAAGGDRGAERLAGHPDRDGGGGHRCDVAALGVPIVPARRGNPCSRARCAGRRPGRRGRALRRLPSRERLAQQLSWGAQQRTGSGRPAAQCQVVGPRAGGDHGLSRENGCDRPGPRRYGLAMPQPPALTPEQRAAALEKAARVRRERAEVKDKLKMGNLSLAQLLTEADSNETIGKMKVVSVLESLPGLGKVKARRLMETVGISDSRRLQGLGAKQRESLLKETAR